MKFGGRVDDAAVRRALDALGRREAVAASNRALNRAMSSVRTEASRTVRAEYRLRARDLADVLKLERAKGAAKVFAELRVRAVRVALSAFGRPSQTRKGVAVTVRRSAGRQLYERAFVARGRGGVEQVFWRVKQGSRLVARGPLRVLLGPAVAQILATKERADRLLEIGRDRFIQVMRQEIRFRITRRAGRALGGNT